MGMAVALAACTPPDPAATRADARTVLLGLAERNFPGIDPEPGVECVLAHARADELAVLARAAHSGVDEETRDTAYFVVARPATRQCLMQNVPELSGRGGRDG